MEAKEKILYKSFELFKRFGLRSVTMDEVASHCGVSKKTVYQYFHDKEDLVRAVVETMTGEAERHCGTTRPLAQNAVHEIFMAMEMVQNMFSGVNPSMMNDLNKYYSNAAGALRKHKQEFMYNFIKKNLERGIAEGLYRPEINIEIITRYQLHNLTVAFEAVVFSDIRFSVLEIDAELTLFSLYGMATGKGVAEIEKYKLEKQKL
jgi:TetR/AcrR family transcriptional regulator, cholesterol catabolism regulator